MNNEPDFKSVFRNMPGIALVVLPNSPDFTLLEGSDEVMKKSSLSREEAIGGKLFDAFPDNPNDEFASGSFNLKNSLEKVIASKRSDRMKITRYDVINNQGAFEEAYWQPLNTPMFDENGNVSYIIHTSENITNKVLSEREAKTSTENFEYFISQATAPFSILKGREFVYTFANKANIRLLNNRPLIGKRLVDALPELKGGAFISVMENVFDTGIPYTASEVPFDAIFEGDTEPSRRYFDFNYIPYRNTKGVIEGLLVSCYDVTRQVENRWQQNKQVINKEAYNLFMQAPVGFSLTRGDNHVFELVNTIGLTLTGKTDDIIGKTVLEVFPEIEGQGYIEILDKVKQKGETITLQETPVTLNNNVINQTRFFNIIYQPYYEANQITGVLSMSTEVTEQVKGRQSLEELKDRFENMANNLPNLSWIANSDGWIFWYNSRWYEYTGTTPEEMEGWGWKSVHHPDTLPEVLDKWQSSIISGVPFEMVFPLKGADDVFRPFLTRVIPIRNKEGDIIRWIGTNTDITKQKEIEKMKENFLSMASHEIKTPVTTIKAYAQLAEAELEKIDNPLVLSMLKKINLQVNKLTKIIGDLLDVTRIQKNKIDYSYTTFDFCEVLEEVVVDAQKINDTHKIINQCEKSILVFADRDKLSQVINNLISNAIKYSPKAEKIILNTTLINQGIQLSVKDFGIGINELDIENIFEQFYRVTGDNQSTYPGMGIGLFISHEIIKRLSGKIWLESTEGEGSVFYIWLPSAEILQG